jgi:hypothetical protein
VVVESGGEDTDRDVVRSGANRSNSAWPSDTGGFPSLDTVEIEAD